MSTYENRETGETVTFRTARDEADLQAMVDRFLAKHPIPEDPEKTARIDAILLERKLKRLRDAR